MRYSGAQPYAGRDLFGRPNTDVCEPMRSPTRGLMAGLVCGLLVAAGLAFVPSPAPAASPGPRLAAASSTPRPASSPSLRPAGAPPVPAVQHAMAAAAAQAPLSPFADRLLVADLKDPSLSKVSTVTSARSPATGTSCSRSSSTST